MVGGSIFIPFFTFLSKDIVPNLSKATSATPYKACTPKVCHEDKFKVLASSSICCSKDIDSKTSKFGLSIKNCLFLIILSEAFFWFIAISNPLPPEPDIKNNGIAAGPAKAIDKEGIKLTVDPATHLPASLILLISSTCIAL